MLQALQRLSLTLLVNVPCPHGEHTGLLVVLPALLAKLPAAQAFHAVHALALVLLGLYVPDPQSLHMRSLVLLGGMLTKVPAPQSCQVVQTSALSATV